MGYTQGFPCLFISSSLRLEFLLSLPHLDDIHVDVNVDVFVNYLGMY